MAEHVIPEEHVVSPRIYLTIFGALLVLTGLTVWVAFYDLRWLNLFVAITIAVVKGTLVVLYFMHLRYSSKLTQVVIVAGIVWFVILLTFTFSDYLTRPWDS